MLNNTCGRWVGKKYVSKLLCWKHDVDARYIWRQIYELDLKMERLHTEMGEHKEKVMLDNLPVQSEPGSIQILKSLQGIQSASE